MRFPDPPCGGVRCPVDDWVDRPDVEALQDVELTGTNTPKTSTHTTLVEERVVFASTMWLTTNNPPPPAAGRHAGVGQGSGWLIVITE